MFVFIKVVAYVVLVAVTAALTSSLVQGWVDATSGTTNKVLHVGYFALICYLVSSLVAGTTPIGAVTLVIWITYYIAYILKRFNIEGLVYNIINTVALPLLLVTLVPSTSAIYSGVVFLSVAALISMLYCMVVAYIAAPAPAYAD